MNTIIAHFKKFRQDLYHLFSSRADATMDLIDALSGQTNADSVVKLSLNELHRRNHESIYAAIQNFFYLKSKVDDAEKDKLEETQAIERTESIKKLTDLLAKQCPKPSESRGYNLFAMDCTSAPRPFARTLSERGVVHTCNPSPGNKPIGIGHQYSLLAYLPEKIEANSSWILPVNMQRVGIEQNGTVVGIEQLTQLVCEPTSPFYSQDNVAVGDTANSSVTCRKLTSEHKNIIFISRIASNRNVYKQPTKIENTPKEFKRPKWFGEKMNLGKTDEFCEVDKTEQTEFINKRGEILKVSLSIWNNMLFRGKIDYHSHKHPFTLIRVEVSDKKDRVIYKKPIWLMVRGQYRNKITPANVFQHYKQRYDIEHFFRLGKQKLLIDKYRTCETQHEENWWHICTLAYTQLYLAKGLADKIPNHWERNLPNYKDTKTTPTASQVQKDFVRIIKEVGTPASSPLIRGIPEGRKKGEIQEKRQKQVIIYKSEKNKQSPPSTETHLRETPVTEEFEKQPDLPKTINYDEILQTLKKLLPQIDMSLVDFLDRAVADTS